MSIGSDVLNRHANHHEHSVDQNCFVHSNSNRNWRYQQRSDYIRYRKHGCSHIVLKIVNCVLRATNIETLCVLSLQNSGNLDHEVAHEVVVGN